MVTEEKLYSDIPPTKLRNKEEKFKPAKTNRFWLTIASLFFFNMLQNRFYAFRYTGVENYKNRDENLLQSFLLHIVIGGMELFCITLLIESVIKKFV